MNLDVPHSINQGWLKSQMDHRFKLKNKNHSSTKRVCWWTFLTPGNKEITCPRTKVGKDW